MDTKTWIAVAAGVATLGLAPAFAADARQESIEIRASEEKGEKDKNEAAREADARTEKAREESARERNDADTESPRRDQRINPNAI